MIGTVGPLRSSSSLSSILFRTQRSPPLPLPSPLLNSGFHSTRVTSRGGGKDSSGPVDVSEGTVDDLTRLYIRCLDSTERGAVHPDDDALLADQDYMGPLAKQWGVVKSTLYNEKEHELTCKGYLRDSAYNSLPDCFQAPAAVPGFTDEGMPLTRKFATESPPIPGFVPGDQYLPYEKISEKYFYEEDGVTKERYGQNR